ncbi:MAG: hypothetical protein Q8N60_03880, partial [Candidatus Diapherotrites archaeon]|nr:hypothetical protein [Candidatus Diapherotrites archaeon]
IAPATQHSFVDKFSGDNDPTVGAPSPGYAVQIYEIELSACGNGICEAELGETFENCPQDCPPPEECVDTDTLMNQYIPRWKRGEISMLTLMQKMRLWNRTVCPA